MRKTTVMDSDVTRAPRRGASRFWLSMALPLLLTGCSSFFEEEEVQTPSLSGEARPAENESYPNLGTVPSERPTVTTEEQRQALRESLREQRQDSLPIMRDSRSGSYGGSDSELPPTPTPSQQSAPSSGSS